MAITPLTQRIRSYGGEGFKNVKNNFAEALAKVVGGRVQAVAAEIEHMASEMGLKQINEKQLAYAYSVAERTSAASQRASPRASPRAQVAGGYTEVQPAEFYNASASARTNYFTKAEVAPYETNMAVTAHYTRPEIPIKELVMKGGAGDGELFEASAIDEAFRSGLSSAAGSEVGEFKLSSAAKALLRQKANAHAAQLLDSLVATGVTPTPKQLR